ncbi:MAG TPA: hypothetical protein VMR54_12400 [Thermoanaerobaculia bacterium]|nr:hypothetical protein [Thermoanaerobaculia bacterium]
MRAVAAHRVFAALTTGALFAGLVGRSYLPWRHEKTAGGTRP